MSAENENKETYNKSKDSISSSPRHSYRSAQTNVVSGDSTFLCPNGENVDIDGILDEFIPLKNGPSHRKADSEYIDELLRINTSDRMSADDLIFGHLRPDDPEWMYEHQLAYARAWDAEDQRRHKDDPAYRDAVLRETNGILGYKDESGIPSPTEEGRDLGFKVPEKAYRHIVDNVWTRRKYEIDEDFVKYYWGRKWKVRLSRVYPMLRDLQWKKCGEYALALSTTGSYFLEIYKSPANVASVYRWLEQVGVVFVYDGSRRFDARTKSKDYGECRLFLVDRERVKALRRLAESLGLDQWWLSDGITKTEFSTGTLLRRYESIAREKSGDERFKELVEKVRMGRNYTALPCDRYTEDEIRAAVIVKFPEIAATMREAAEGNKKRAPWEQVVARINVTRSRPSDKDKVAHYTKIGFRTTSHYASMRKRPRAQELRDPDETYKEDMFDQHFDGCWYSSDTTSAIPKVNYALNTGVFLPDSVDLYEKAFRPECMSETMFRDNHFRDIFKNPTLVFSFVPSSKAARARMLGRDKPFKKATTAFCSAYGKERMEKTIRGMMDSLTDACGGRLWGEYGFVAESFVEQYVLNKATELSIKKNLPNPLQIYDELVVSGRLFGSKEEFEEAKQRWYGEAMDRFMEIVGKKVSNKEGTGIRDFLRSVGERMVWNLRQGGRKEGAREGAGLDSPICKGFGEWIDSWLCSGKDKGRGPPKSRNGPGSG